MSDAWIAILLTVGFGAMAGGLTNAVAIWMLFHPYEPPRFLGRRWTLFEGAIPKNKPRLASAIGRTVGTRLLTSEDLANTLSAPAFREAFHVRLAAFLGAMLDRRHGSLEEMLPSAVTIELRSALNDATTALLLRLDGYLEGDEFRTKARRWAVTVAGEVRERPLSELLTPEREERIVAAAEGWLDDLVGGSGFEQAIRDYLDRGSVRLLEPGRTFEEIIPVGMVASIERAIAGYLPIALERLGSLLEEPGTRETLEKALHEIFDRFLRDLKFHQRLVAALVITPDVVDRVLGAIEKEGANKIAELLHDETVRDTMARKVNQAIVDFMRKEVRSVLGAPGDSTVEEAKETVLGWALNLSRDPQTRGFLIEKIRATLGKAEERTWGDLFDQVPPEKIADGIVSVARSEALRDLYREAAEKLAARIIERPIGRPADLLPEDAPARIEAALAPPIWGWIQDQVPEVVQKIDIARRVEQKVLDYPVPQLEALIKGVTERELKLIVQLGYALGAVIGLISALLNLALR